MQSNPPDELSSSSGTDLPGKFGPWETFSDFERDCGLSRFWGGVHFLSSLSAGQQLCKPIGDLAYEFVDRHVRGGTQ